MDYKTPGVYVEELQLIPPSVASVATAIPAFIGHTAVTLDTAGATLINIPVRLNSMLDFTTVFGGAYDPASYEVQVAPGAGFNILNITPANGRRYYLFDAVRHYFDNGGGPCYVVTVGNYTADVVFGDNATGLRGGLQSLAKVDEPTLILSPDSMALRLPDGTPDFVQAGNLHKAIIDQCGRLQDRFGILDMMEGYRAPDHASTPVAQFRTQVGTENLKYAAVYYPWLNTTYLKEIRFAQLSFVDDQAIPVAIPDATIDTMTGNPALDALVTDLRARRTEEERVFSKVTAVALNRNNYNPLGAQFNTLRTAVMGANTALLVRPLFTAMMTFVQELALAFRDLEDDAGNSPGLVQLLTSLRADTGLQDQIISLIAFEKNTHVMNSISTTRVEGDVDTEYDSLDLEDWVGGVAINTIAADATDFTTPSVAQTAQLAANSPILQTAFDTIAQAFTALVQDAAFRTDQAEKNLFAKHPFFKAVYERIRKDMSLLPPSGAVAGVYAATDRSRGVWKAPANMSLRGVIEPAYKLTDQEQSSLNVHDTGKSVNAIRAFTGKGILVWGARTLAGNDNEWRYVNVRRFFNYVEESTKKASEPFVFENNDANTWVRIRAMIENFLTLQWRQGALAGATTKEAFYVKVGLGETMTAQDILEGRLIVEIGMAAVRPAEFIVLRFSHKMQES